MNTAKEAHIGIYLNPGAQLLRMSRRSRIYIDKSGVIPFLNRVSNTACPTPSSASCA